MNRDLCFVQVNETTSFDITAPIGAEAWDMEITFIPSGGRGPMGHYDIIVVKNHDFVTILPAHLVQSWTEDVRDRS